MKAISERLDPTERPVTVTVRNVEPVATFRRGADTVTVQRFFAEVGPVRVVWESDGPFGPGDRFVVTFTETAET